MAPETDEDATASTEISDKVLIAIEERIEATKVSNEDVGEDQEEGELSEKEELNDEEKTGENTQAGTEASAEVPLLGRKVSLDKRTGRATMGRDDYLKRGAIENLSTDDEENTWLRDKVAFRPASTSYAPNLYNFAWAQAVQGNQGFKLVERQGGEDEAEELPDNEADYEDDDAMEDSLPESLADMTLKIPEGYDMRQVLYDKRLMKNASWNASRGDGRRETNWMESEDGVDPRRRFEREERGGPRVVVRREMSPPSRRRDGRVVSRRDRLEADTERERGSERVLEIDRQRARDRERHREKGRERSERNGGSLRPDSSEESNRSAPSGANGRQSQSGDNVADVPEEGEIEEGEIELPAANSTRSGSREKSEDPRADSPLEDVLPNGNLKRSLSSRLSFRNSDSRSLSRESSFRRLQDDDLRHRLTKDAEREKSREEAKLREDRREKITHLTALMKSVTVKDAQKAFINTCVRLDNAVRILKAFAKQRISTNIIPADDMPRDVSKMASKVFQGLRAVYAVWNTASGREQERDRDTFPRLLQFVTGSCLKFFSPKQARELEEFMEHVTKTSRKTRMEGLLRPVQAAPKPVEATQDTGARLRELSANASVSNPKMTSGISRALESSPEHTTGSKDAMAAADIAAAAVAYAQSSAAAFANFSTGSTYNQPMKDHPTIELGHWGWNGSNEPFEQQSMSPGLPPGYSSVSHAGRSLVPHGVAPQTIGNLNPHGVGAIHPSLSNNGWANVNKKVVCDVKSPYGPGFLEEDWEELSPPSQLPAYAFTTRKVVKLDERGFPISSSETINTVAPPKKVGNLPVSVNFRLASPTPSEEDDEAENQNTSSSAADKNVKTQPENILFHPPQKSSGTTPAVTTAFYKTLSSHIDEAGRTHYASTPQVTSASVNQDFSLNFEHPKNPPVSGPVISNLRSRDPRRQPQNGYTEGEVTQHQSAIQAKNSWQLAVQTMERKREGEDHASVAEPSKRLKISGSRNEAQNSDSSVGVFALGGWLEEGAAMSPGHENNGVQAMDIDLDSPTPPDRKRNMNDEKAGVTFSKHDVKRIEISSGSGSSEMVGSGIAASIRIKPPSDVPSNNSMKSEAEEDAGRHRMRPRDPRRILLESAAENVHVNQRNVPVNEASDSGVTPQQKKRNSPPPPPPQTLIHQPLSNTLGNAHDQRAGRLNPNEMNQGMSNTISSKKLPSERKILASKEETQFHETNKESGRESIKKFENEAREVSSGDPTKEEVSEHLDPWDSLLRKPRFGPSHWGGSEMHRDFEHLLEDLDAAQRVLIQNERKRRMQEQDRMFSAGKLCLVLDLDHTLLNSAKFAEIEPEWEVRLRSVESMERSRGSREGNMKQELYRFPHMSMWTKLRPGIWKFLAKASELYELHVYTMGNKAYATEMAKLLDPTGTLFAGRVISKGDEVDGLDKSKDLDGVLGMESAVVIIDDSSRVWPHHRENLIVVERYMYFPSSRRQFGLPGPSLLEVGHDERAADGMLSSALAVIDRIHRNFFSNKRLREVDVRLILAAEQRMVLGGCHVLFSRIFPVGEVNSHMHPLWRLAEQFGASCCLHINDKVTHVVAISLGTDKVNWASATGRPVVRPAWLEASAILYRRANEQDFPVPP